MSQQQLHRLNRERLAAGKSVLVVTDYHCRHLGEFDRHVRCNCPSKSVPAFECRLHEVCTVQRPAADKSIKHCADCADYFPRQSTG